MQVAVAGGTGVVGRELVRQLRAFEEHTVVTAPGRRPAGAEDERLRCPGVADVAEMSEWLAALPEGLDVALCSLGTTRRRAGSGPAFRRVDLQGVAAFAAAARQRGARVFGLVSSIGADAASRALYLRTKGEAEAAIVQLGFPHVVILRPSFIDDGGTREDFRPLERMSLPLARRLLPPRGVTARWAPVSAEAIAACLLAASVTPGAPVTIVENDAILEFARSKSRR